MSICPYCQNTTRQVRSGKNPSGSQRYLCKVCSRKYTPEPNSCGYPSGLRKQAVLLCLDGQSFRSIAARLSVNHQTIANWVDAYIAKSARAIYKLPR